MEAASALSLKSVRVPRALLASVAFLLVGVGLILGYVQTSTPVTLVINGQERQLRTQQETVGAFLLSAGVHLREADRVEPGLEATITPQMRIHIDRAHPVWVHADGHDVLVHTQAESVDAVLQEVECPLRPVDELAVEGSFPSSSTGTVTDSSEPVHVTVQRAVSFTLHEDGQSQTFKTTCATVGEALHEQGVTLYLADGVEPGLEQPLSPGMDVFIERSIPVTVHVDGRTLRTRTHRERVGDVLADLGVVLSGQDMAIPDVDATLEQDVSIRVVRVTERFITEQELIPFESVWQADPELEIDHTRLLQDGSPGVRERRIRVRYEDGEEVERTVEGEYVAVPPQNKVMGYGTKIVVRTMNTPSGPVEYWRVIRVLATSYSASTAGTSPTSPWYGYTRTGMRMRKGIVAVDPRLIPLHTRLYVPGYGVGYAGDTGGWIKGRRIDLGYDDHNLELWYNWVNVYLLTPVPPAHKIDYVLDF